MVKILDVEADPDEAATLAALLADEFRLIHCPDPARAAQAVRREAPAAILFDPARYAEAGHRALEALARSREGPPVIVMSARAEPSRVLCALRRGAYDFLARPCGLHELKSALRSAVEARTYACAPFTGSSPALRKAAALLADYARHEYPVLILGESGTGKDVAARALHEASPLRGARVVLIDTLPGALVAAADVVLPSVTWAEKAGTFENVKGRLQSFPAAIPALDFARSESTIALDLMTQLTGRIPEGFDATAVRAEMAGIPALAAFGAQVHHPPAPARVEPDLVLVEL